MLFLGPRANDERSWRGVTFSFARAGFARRATDSSGRMQRWVSHRALEATRFGCERGWTEFWILNSIEFRLNDVSKRIREIERLLR